MSDAKTEKKINWLAIISIVLGLLLITQTAGILYWVNKKEEPKKATAVSESDLVSALRQGAYPSAGSAMPRYANRSPSLYSRSPWSVFDDMQDSMSQMMGGFMASLPGMMSQMNQHMGIDAMPLMDMEEKNNAYIVQVDMPGLDKNKIDITVRGEILTIQGQRETVNQEQSGSFYTQERSYGSFSRSLRLPGPVDETNIQAEYKNGVLEITLPKITKAEASKKISVV